MARGPGRQTVRTTQKDVIMSRTTLMLLTLLAASPLTAQQIPAPTSRSRAPAMAPEDLLRMKSLLDLNKDQVTRLQTLRQEALEVRRAEMGRMLEFRSQLRSGEVAREDARKSMLERRTELRKQFEAQREQLNAVLNDQQREKLETLRREMQLRRRADGGRAGRGGMGPRRPAGHNGWDPPA